MDLYVTATINYTTNTLPADARVFTNITEALTYANRLTGPVRIHLMPGIYEECIQITQPNITLIGTDATNTVIVFSHYAKESYPGEAKRGTFRSQSIFIDADNFAASNITFSNASGDGSMVGQAIALYCDGDNMQFFNCRFTGFQDTLFTAPLPPKELEPGGFRGPKEFLPRRSGRHWYYYCYIEGTIDFIFGGATCYFEKCDIFSKPTLSTANGYITAASTPEEQLYGYVFDHCRFIGCAPIHSVYLGRPWREHAHVAILHSYFDSHIHPDHWHDWGKSSAHASVCFVEYENYGPGAVTQLPSFSRFLESHEIEGYSFEKVFPLDLKFDRNGFIGGFHA